MLVSAWTGQLAALLYQKSITFKRQWLSSSVIVFGPCCLVALHGIVLHSSIFESDNVYPDPVFDNVLPKCHVFSTGANRVRYGMPIPKRECITLAFAPISNKQVKEIMGLVAEKNNLELDKDVRGFASERELNAFLTDGDSEDVFAAVVFNDSSILSPVTQPSQGNTEWMLAYEIWYNETVHRNDFLKNAGQDPLKSFTRAHSSYILQVQRSINEALVAAHTGKAFDLHVDLTPFAYARLVENDGLDHGNFLSAARMGPIYYCGGMVMCFLVVLRTIMQDKQSNILGALRMNGLYESVYWISILVFYIPVMVVAAGLVVCAGRAFNIPMFVYSDNGFVWLLYFLTLMVLTSSAMALGSICPTTRSSVVMSFILLITGLAFQLALLFASEWVILWPFNPWIFSSMERFCFTLHPLLVFSKIHSNMVLMTMGRAKNEGNGIIHSRYTWDIARNGAYQWRTGWWLEDALQTPSCSSRDLSFEHECFTYSTSCYCDWNKYDPMNGPACEKMCTAKMCSAEWGTSVSEQDCAGKGGRYFEFTDIYGQIKSECQCQFTIPSDADSLGDTVYTILLYTAIAWYFGQVLAFGKLGKAEPLWFPILPWYWTKSISNPFETQGARPSGVGREDQDRDVQAEQQAVISGARDDHKMFPVVIRGAVKEFRPLCSRSHRAVDGIYLGLRTGQCFALLGHNGAGKTTLINCLSGATSLTGGDCTINGISMRSHAESLRHLIGVCPQHDVLWKHLNAREHLLFYGIFRGMPFKQCSEQSERLLKKVNLDGISRVAGKYSGGMRRRLSMTIAAMGNTKSVIFLDEPTTGLDPQNQRHVWDLINELKQDRVVVLTTHLIDEADVLGDEIGIMSKGRLIALGNPLHLKGRFGGRYKLSLDAVVDESSANQADAAKRLDAQVKEIMPRIVHCALGRYEIPRQEFANAPALFRWIQDNKGTKVKEWNLGQTSLEEIFIALETNRKQAAQVNSTPHHAGDCTPAAPALQADAVFDNSDLAYSPTLKQQMRGLFIKSLILHKRQVCSTVCQILLPLGLVILMGALEGFARNNETTQYYDPYEPSVASDGAFQACTACLSLQLAAHYSGLTTSSGPGVEYFAGAMNASSLFSSPHRVAYLNLQQAQTYDKAVQNNWYSLENPFYHYCVANVGNGMQDKIALSALSWGNLVVPECASMEAGLSHTVAHKQVEWFSSFLQGFNAEAIWGNGQHFWQPRLLVGGVDLTVKERLGQKCGASELRSGVFTPVSKTHLLVCLPVEPKSLLYLNSDPDPDQSCHFPSSAEDKHQEWLEKATTSGLLAHYPGRLLQVQWENGLKSEELVFPSVSLCGIPSNAFASFETTNQVDDLRAVQEMVYSNQVQVRDETAEFVKYMRADAQDVPRAQDLLAKYFPPVAAIFQSLDLGAGVARVSILSYYPYWDSTRQQSCVDGGAYPYSIIRGHQERQDEDPWYYCNIAAAPVTRFGLRWSGSDLVHMANFVLNGLTTSLLRAVGGGRLFQDSQSSQVTVSVGVRAFPERHPLAKEEEVKAGAEDFLKQMMATLLLPPATMFLLPVFVYHLVNERELGLHTLMLQFGLRPHFYWAVQYAFNFCIAMIVLMVIYVMAVIFDLRVLTDHQFGIVLVLFFCWANGLSGTAFFLSLFFKRTRNALLVTHFMLFGIVIASFAVNLAEFEEEPHRAAPAWWVWFPPFCFCRALFLLSLRTYFWEDLALDDEMVQLWLWLLLEGAILTGLVLSMGQIARFTRLLPSKIAAGMKKGGKSAPRISPDVEPSKTVDTEVGIRLERLSKRFGRIDALDQVSMDINRKACTALLGPNGAGKSTAIGILTGVLSPCSGDAVYAPGHSILNMMHVIHKQIGVCPQHDLFWPSMTVEEHLLLFLRLRGALRENEPALVENALNVVQILPQKMQRVSTLSGGQRRRLSVACAFLGNPKCVFLDEPTTGIDAHSRNRIQQMILKEKRHRSIILTTHLMEEAEVLSDQIAIFAHGKIRALGTLGELKRQFDQGLRLSVIAPDPEAGLQAVKDLVPGTAELSLESRINQKLVFHIVLSGKSFGIAELWQALHDSGNAAISDWQLEATNLKQVFLQIARESEAMYGTA